MEITTTMQRAASDAKLDLQKNPSDRGSLPNTWSINFDASVDQLSDLVEAGIICSQLLMIYLPRSLNPPSSHSKVFAVVPAMAATIAKSKTLVRWPSVAIVPTITCGTPSSEEVYMFVL
jgi:hypothetical protein